jgi:glucosylceramidase
MDLGPKNMRKPLILFVLALLALAVRPAVGQQRPASNEPVEVWMTTADRNMLLQRLNDRAFTGSAPSAPSTITVDEQLSYQTMDGFGAAMSGASAYLINRLAAPQRDALLTELYTGTGLRMNLVRHSMGASDFSAQGDFTYDDQPAGQTDPTLSGFNLTHDQVDLIPVLQAALLKNNRLKIFGTPWTAPAWMKQRTTLHGDWLNTAYYQAYAAYFVKYVQGYAALGLPVYAVTLQNEPLHNASAYPSMRMDAGNQASFLKNNIGPAFQTAGLTTKLIVYDHNWDRPDFPNDVFADPQAARYAAGAAFHCYGGSVDQQSVTHNAYPTKGLWFTECSGTTGTSFGPDLRYNVSNVIIGATRNWSKGSLFWNVALDLNNGPTNGGCTTCRGVLTIDPVTGQITRNVEYYALGHASKFVSEGAVRIGSGSVSGGLETVAFRNPDSSRVLLVLNNSRTPATYRVAWRGQAFTHSLLAGAVVTYKWTPASVLSAAPEAVAAALAARLQVYPATVGRALTLEYDSQTRQALDLTFLDVAGRVVLHPESLRVEPGNNRLLIPVTTLRGGAYVLLVRTTEGVIRRRVGLVEDGR